MGAGAGEGVSSEVQALLELFKASGRQIELCHASRPLPTPQITMVPLWVNSTRSERARDPGTLVPRAQPPTTTTTYLPYPRHPIRQTLRCRVQGAKGQHVWSHQLEPFGLKELDFVLFNKQEKHALMVQAQDRTDSFRCSSKSLGNHSFLPPLCTWP